MLRLLGESSLVERFDACAARSGFIASDVALRSYRSSMRCIVGGGSAAQQAHRDEIHDSATEQPPGATGRAAPASGSGGLPGRFV
jgi:hypothetical protein